MTDLITATMQQDWDLHVRVKFPNDLSGTLVPLEGFVAASAFANTFN